MNDLATKTGDRLLDYGSLGILSLFLAAGVVVLGVAVAALWRENRSIRTAYDAKTDERLKAYYDLANGLKDTLASVARRGVR